MITTDWGGVRERVEALARRDKADVLFGYGGRGHGHRLRLDAPLSEEQLDEAEARLRVTLPADYRSFLLQVGAGGAGPFYGIGSLVRQDDGWSWNGPGLESDLGRLHLPFAGEDVITEALAEHDGREPVLRDFPGIEEFSRAFKAWDGEGEVLFRRMATGAVRLSHFGCGAYYWLVVSGSERGHLWVENRPVDLGFTPLTRPEPRVTFTRWYLDWLAAAEDQVDRASR
ncbi:hypothetical protein F4560_008277 [Saccharothrix ecbatanensis]|uniref:Knr4/Smi1-like domain-containing protein n=1 Tax=Saccharothrix ecbatanensis TaxID=1105145 RepID=A0A7W9HV17_9PSEU|nr:SMI1/KNR4 family protein [Saccharothrix ecbatanensis]MBB5808509.1 hypothetical protein [Saccharothrix ecbatanensis]